MIEATAGFRKLMELRALDHKEQVLLAEHEHLCNTGNWDLESDVFRRLHELWIERARIQAGKAFIGTHKGNSTVH